MPPITQRTASQRISDFQQFVNQNQRKIRQCGNKAWHGLTTRHEPERVHEFLSSRSVGMGLLNRELVPVLSKNGWVVKFASIFLHQVPKVRGTLPDGRHLNETCELGDLQTIFVYLRADKTVLKMRSVIFQAKMKPLKSGHVINSYFQRALYDDCPSFTYESVLPGTARTMPTGADRERAFQYLFIGKSPALARTIPSAVGYGAFEEYGEHLLRFLNDSTGLDVEPRPSTGQGWSRTVWDMIDHVAEKFTSSGRARQSGLRDILDHFNSFEKHDQVFFDPDQTDGPPDRKGKEGYGVQLVIVWDSTLDGDQESTPPKPLDQIRSFADTYDALEKSGDARAMPHMDQISGKIAALIREHALEYEAVLAEYLSSPSTALIAGLAQAASRRGETRDMEFLWAMIPKLPGEHPLLLLLNATARYFATHPFQAHKHMAKVKAMVRKTKHANNAQVKAALSAMEKQLRPEITTHYTKQIQRVRII